MKNILLRTLCLSTLWALYISLPVSANIGTHVEKNNPSVYNRGASEIEGIERSYTIPFIETWDAGTFENQDWT